MKTANDILIKVFGKGYKKNLTEDEISAMIRSDRELFETIPDNKRYKSKFIYQIIDKYTKLEVNKLLFWEKELERLETQYPLIHTGENNE